MIHRAYESNGSNAKTGGSPKVKRGRSKDSPNTWFGAAKALSWLKVESAFFRTGRTKVLVGIAGLMALIAAADRAVGATMSLGIFYIVPMVIGATVLPWPGIVLLAIACSLLRS
jgi:hypothetical protein